MAQEKTPSESSRFIKVDRRQAEKVALRLEIGLAEGLLAVNPKNAYALEMLAAAYSRAGRHEDALQADLRLTEMRPKNGHAYYNLACSHSNLGQIDEGLAALRRALELGFRDYSAMMRDADLERLRQDPRFQQLLDRRWGKRQSR